MNWYFSISRKQTNLLLSLPVYQNYGRHSLGRQSAFLWRNVLWFATQGKDAAPSPHYDHQTLIFPSSLPRGLALLVEILHFLEKNDLSSTVVLVGINSDRADRQKAEMHRSGSETVSVHKLTGLTGVGIVGSVKTIRARGAALW